MALIIPPDAIARAKMLAKSQSAAARSTKATQGKNAAKPASVDRHATKSH